MSHCCALNQIHPLRSHIVIVHCHKGLFSFVKKGSRTRVYGVISTLRSPFYARRSKGLCTPKKPNTLGQTRVRRGEGKEDDRKVDRKEGHLGTTTGGPLPYRQPIALCLWRKFHAHNLRKFPPPRSHSCRRCPQDSGLFGTQRALGLPSRPIWQAPPWNSHAQAPPKALACHCFRWKGTGGG